MTVTSARMPARTLRLLGEVERNHEAVAHSVMPGDAVLVNRGRLRAIVIACPDGCGEHLTVNLDRDAGPAWRLYQRQRGVTLFPSVWRDTGCKSHFIIWHDTILWCDWFTEGNREPENLDQDLPQKIWELLTDRFEPFVDIAAILNEIPWEVNRSCAALRRKGLAQEAQKPMLGHYRRMPDANLTSSANPL